MAKRVVSPIERISGNTFRGYKILKYIIRCFGNNNTQSKNSYEIDFTRCDLTHGRLSPLIGQELSFG